MRKSIKSLVLILISGFVFINFSYCTGKVKTESATSTEKSEVIEAAASADESKGVIHLTSETFKDEVGNIIESCFE